MSRVCRQGRWLWYPFSFWIIYFLCTYTIHEVSVFLMPLFTEFRFFCFLIVQPSVFHMAQSFVYVSVLSSIKWETNTTYLKEIMHLNAQPQSCVCIRTVFGCMSLTSNSWLNQIRFVFLGTSPGEQHGTSVGPVGCASAPAPGTSSLPFLASGFLSCACWVMIARWPSCLQAHVQFRKER